MIRHTRLVSDWSSDVCSSDRSEEHTSELQSLTNLVCRLIRSEEHTSELQSLTNLVCRLLLEKKKCDMCYDRIIKGEIPSCAEACPGEAIMFGTRRELLAEARRRIAERPFFFNDTATTEIYTLSLHDALPIYKPMRQWQYSGMDKMGQSYSSTC